MHPLWAEAETDSDGDAPTAQRGVIVKKGDDFLPRMVQVGVSNFDQTEIIDGVEEGDEVVYAFFSRALQSSEEFRQRLSSRANMSGFRSSSTPR